MVQDPFTPILNIEALYARFQSPITDQDCGQFCRAHNPRGIPICCDIREAVPAVYFQEWDFLKTRTDHWHLYQDDENYAADAQLERPEEQVPEHMLLLACKGIQSCQRRYRSFSCRQFPFFPYVSEDYRFIGLAYEWALEETCWVISHLSAVSAVFRVAFIAHFDEIFALWQAEMESYACHSENMRRVYLQRRRRIPLLHRNGNDYLLSPGSERIHKIDPQKYPRFGPYR